MNNRDLEATWTYHNATKHSQWSVRTIQHYLDWENQPVPFKIYRDLEPIPLPRDIKFSGVPALTAISAVDVHQDGERIPDLTALTNLLYFSAGITKRKTYPGGEILFRAASCTGAMYHIELYLVCGNLPGLEAGVYHFGAHDLALRRLRQGDYRGALACASGAERAISRAPATLICTGTFWRNAWKYQARSYRHSYWDNGTILANVLALAAAQEIPARIVSGFVDSSVNLLLGLDTTREAALTLVPLGFTSATAPKSPPLELLELEIVPLSKKEVDYPLIRDMHAASSLGEEQEVREWRGRAPGADPVDSEGRLFGISRDNEEAPPDTIEEVILRRGSTRQFGRVPITQAQLSKMLRSATRGIPADFLEPPGTWLSDLYLIANAVDGLAGGAYVYHRDKEALELLREGDFRQDAGYLGLEQELPADASADVFVLADLNPILRRFGNRGYRVAQLEAGIIGGKLYLAAYAQHLGASGLTFYDDDVTSFFSPHANGKSAMFLVALGKSAKMRAK